MEDPVILEHTYNLSPRANGGESLRLKTKFFWNQENSEGIYWNQDLILQSYSNSSTLNLIGTILTPKLLRQLADALEEAQDKAKSNVKDIIQERLDDV